MTAVTAGSARAMGDYSYGMLGWQWVTIVTAGSARAMGDYSYGR